MRLNAFKLREKVHSPSNSLTQIITCELKLKRKTLSSVQIHPGIENVAAKSSHLVSTLRHRATHRTLFRPAQDNRARGNYPTDQRNKSITSLSLHLSDGLIELAIYFDNHDASRIHGLKRCAFPLTIFREILANCTASSR